MSKQDYAEALRSLERIGIRLTPKGDTEFPRNHFWQNVGDDREMLTVALHKSDVPTSPSTPNRHWFGLRAQDVESPAPPDFIFLWAKDERHAFKVPGQELHKFLGSIRASGQGKVEGKQWHINVEFAPLSSARILPVDATNGFSLAPYAIDLRG